MNRTEYNHIAISRGYRIQVMDAVNPTNNAIKMYDIELAYGGRYICTLGANCYGEKSAEYWYEYWTYTMRRYMHLIKQIDRENNNLLAYSNSLLMNAPKDGYEEKWSETQNELDMLHKWLQQMTNTFNDEIKASMMKEFDIYYVL